MIKFKIFEQTKTGYCGPAALRAILNFYGLKISEQALGRKSKTSIKEGTDPENLITAVKSFGWHGFWKENATVSDIRYFLKQGKPVLVDWFSLYGEHYEGHYSVIIGMDNQYIFLADPEIGRIRKVLKEAFKKVWFDFEGPHIKNAKRLYFEWMLVPSPKKLDFRAGSKIKGHYF
jgi:predicted double-glycine peptidase